ncbi:hypothetical protein OHC33_001389 [Knufia fluminis]|uniref:Uncharacterized protein n=1 Tax=Knufia fluminis TaxID=191047 RepID=A0AAN8IBG5_9EURO|nr:hypothetical protein OHC33_001389 [Knufia fluminis]
MSFLFDPIESGIDNLLDPLTSEFGVLAPTAATSVQPPEPMAQSNSHEPSSKPDSKVSTAGIVVAIVFAVALLISIIWLTIRFCPPVRRRIDAWSTARRNNRTYREALDGPPPPGKDYAYSLSSNSSQQRKSVSAQAAEKIGVGKRPFSFFGIGGNPSIEQQQKSGYFWQVESASGPVHQQYFSPNSAETPKGNGLGLGRVSLLRNHSLLRKAGHDVPPVPGPSMTQTQAEIVGMGHISRQIALPLQPQVARKPLPARLPIPVKAASPRSRPFSYEAEHARIPRPVRSTESIQSARLKHKNSPLPKLQLKIPPTPLERRSQIGLAVTSSTPPVHVR